MDDSTSPIENPKSKIENAYDLIIGLEVHVQLLTESKLFCGCSTRFGSPPNTQTCPVCIGMPGTLPVMNRRAFDLSLRTAVALNCGIAPFTKWDRKNYYYPDLPKGYQISQYDLPFSHDGWLELFDPKGRVETRRIGIIRAHLEEDAGKSMHDEQAGEADSRIDLNRTGTPLLEIVSQPDLRSPAEAKAYLTELKLLLTYLGVSDCNMQEGSLRVDANVNLHVHTPQGKVPTPIVEVKNMNSFRAVERALAHEAERQWAVWQETGQRLGDVPKQTRGWDDAANVTRGQRHKEESSDYRYFPDPDLVPVTVTEDELTSVREGLGELPAALRQRLERTYAITPYDSDVLVNQGRALADYYIELAEACGDGKLASNWMQQDVLRTLNEQSLSIQQFAHRLGTPTDLATLIQQSHAGILDTSHGRRVFSYLMSQQIPVTSSTIAEAIKRLGITRSDEWSEYELSRELVESNRKLRADIQAGKSHAVGALIGQAKKRNKNVSPGRLRDMLLDEVKQVEQESKRMKAEPFAQGLLYEKLTQALYTELKRITTDGLHNVTVQRNVKLQGQSGVTHQADVCVITDRDGVPDKLVIECKHYTRAVALDSIRSFAAMLQDVGNCKGLMVTTTGFQSGVQQFAQHYGIGLKLLRSPTDDDWQGRLRNITVEMQAKAAVSTEDHPVSVNVVLGPKSQQEEERLRTLLAQQRLRVPNGPDVVLRDKDGVPQTDELRWWLPQQLPVLNHEPGGPYSDTIALVDTFILANQGTPDEVLLPVRELQVTYWVESIDLAPIVIDGDTVVEAVLRDFLSGKIEHVKRR